jgi:hypothetical protein
LRGLYTHRPRRFALHLGSPARRVWLPSRRCQLSLPSEASFSLPRSWVLPFRALFRFCGPLVVSQKSSARAFLHQVFRLGADASAAFAHKASGILYAPSLSSKRERDPCPLELWHLSGLSPLSLGRSIFLLPAPPALSPFISEKMKSWNLRGFFSPEQLPPLLEGAYPCGVFNRRHLPPF